MHGRVAGALLWCAATAGATLLVQSGVGTIRAATRRDAVVDVQAIDVRTARAPGPTANGPSPSASVATSAPPSTTGGPAPSGGPVPATTAGPAPTTAPTVPPPAAPPSEPPPTSAAITRTIVARGGTVSVRYQPDEVTVLAATPNPGYSVDISRGGTRVRIEFEAADRRSRVEAWWDGDARHEVRED